LEEFVGTYLESIYDRTDFYKNYTPGPQLADVSNARDKMTREFVITGWDYYGPGSYEYAVRFANGATAVVAVYEKNEKVQAATLLVQEAGR
jgi:hypothetical protein